MSTEAKKDSKIKRYFKAPVKALGKARDFYVRSLSNCAGSSAGYGCASGCNGPQMAPLPRSFSVNSTASTKDEELRDLIRAASSKEDVGNKIALELLQRQMKQSLPVKGDGIAPRSPRVANIGKIDEDKPAEFGDFDEVNPDVFAGNKSNAISKKTRMTT